jgi:ribonuclease D
VSPRSNPRDPDDAKHALAGDAEVAQLARAARDHGRLAIDTEFVGERRYRTLLCLVQVAVPAGEKSRVAVVDAIDATLDLEPLRAALEDPEVEVVVHAGRQDVALLRGRWGAQVNNVFDTQVAAAFAGLRAQAGYEGLLREVLGERLRKSASYTRWDTRPLTAEQIDYARADVVHLLDLAAELRRRLDERGRLGWALEECRALEQASDERDPDAIFERLPRIGGMDPAVRARARELVEWREQTAEREDRPAGSVLNDSALVEVARRRPDSVERLEQIRGVSAPTLHRRGRSLLAAVARGSARPPIPAEPRQRTVVADEDGPLVALAEALVRARALEEQLAYELLATRAELQRVVAAVRDGRSPEDARLLQGWRGELAGAELVELLRGRRTLSVGTERRLRIAG